MGQELIALNGNEQFPYQLKPDDIANAMGLPNGIAPGGYNSDGAITTTSIANSSGEVLLEDNAWNNVVEVSGETTSITLPSSDPTNAIITFYPKTPPASDPNSTWTLEANNSQYLYSPTTGIINNTTTSIDVPYTNSLTILSRGNGEIDIIGGTYLLTNNLYPSILNPLTIPNAVGNNNPLTYGQAFQSFIPTGSETISPTALRTIVMPNFTEEGTITVGPGNIFGQEIEIFGCNYNVTIASTVTSGNPHFLLPDNSVIYNWTILANLCGQSIKMRWDNVTWRIITFGQTIVAPATQNGAAVNLGQFPSSLTASGYQTLPSGLIIQWGIFSGTASAGTSSGNIPITLPIAFPNNAFISMANSSDDLSSIFYGALCPSLSQINIGWVNINSSSLSMSGFWVAFGN